MGGDIVRALSNIAEAHIVAGRQYTISEVDYEDDDIAGMPYQVDGVDFWISADDLELHKRYDQVLYDKINKVATRIQQHIDKQGFNTFCYVKNTATARKLLIDFGFVSEVSPDCDYFELYPYYAVARAHPLFTSIYTSEKELSNLLEGSSNILADVYKNT